MLNLVLEVTIYKIPPCNRNRPRTGDALLIFHREWLYLARHAIHVISLFAWVTLRLGCQVIITY